MKQEKLRSSKLRHEQQACIDEKRTETSDITRQEKKSSDIMRPVKLENTDIHRQETKVHT